MIRRIAWLLVFSPAFLPATAQDQPKTTPPEGVLPTGADGKPLNLDFETGTLKDWTATGDAFEGQPVKGDTVFPRRSDMKSQHQGNYWIGTFEHKGDKPQGALTSVPFKVTHPWASFLVGGGPHDTTCVELYRKDSGERFHIASGYEEENLRREVVDLKPHMGQEIFIRLVDKHSGHWGHINFDDFRFHSEKPNFPKRPNPAKPAPPDQYKYAGLPAKKAAEVMTVPEGFDVKLFAGEPDVVQPLAMCLDDRGRVWVVEGMTYPQRRKPKGPDSPFVADGVTGDRILIFEDEKGDGHFTKRTVFMEGLNLVSGIEVGFGGVWIGAAPYLLFVPMKDDKPAAEPKILLDGWGYQDTHETLNSFIWGPDGWLYGCHGVFTHSLVGKPGTPKEQRTPLNAAIWRYHPTRHVFEIFAEGTSNPWGLDFNDYGEAFCEACVIPHCFHIIQGGRYTRQAGNHFNPHTYADIETIADHLHWQGQNQWVSANRSDAFGGGHAHCGLMCYLGGAWPKEYRGQLFMGNIHGRRINMDTLKSKGSGYVASHGKDFLLANDAWARFINMRYGPDGNVYLIDWYDKQACHTTDIKVNDRDNGRIYKICYRGTKPVQVDLAKKTDAELVEYQLHENDWYVRHARRLLQERYPKGITESPKDPLPKEAVEWFGNLIRRSISNPDPKQRLRLLWTLNAIQGLETENYIGRMLRDGDEHVRGWNVQLALEKDPNSQKLHKAIIRLLDREEESPIVLRYIASGLQRIEVSKRLPILDELLGARLDVTDSNIPLLIWYAMEPVAGWDAGKALDLSYRSPIPSHLGFMVRRIASSGKDDAIELIAHRLDRTDVDAARLTVLSGLLDALKGRRQVAMPKTWPKTFERFSKSDSAEVRAQSLALAIVFGDPIAFAELRKTVTNTGVAAARRREALASLLGAKDKELVPVLHKLIADADLRGQALKGLAMYDDPKTPGLILDAYSKFNSAEKRDALATLASRLPYAGAMLDAVAAKKVAPADVSADIVRQLRNLKNKDLDKRIADVWGVVRDTPAERAKLIAQAKSMLTKPAKTDVALGRAVFQKTCANCHKLFGVGREVGPDITGANRQSLDYLLENIFDPSAIIPKEYAASVIELNDGRFITGIIKSETKDTLTILTATENLTLPQKEIASKQTSDKSMMPDDQAQQMKDHEFRALIAYLQSPGQTPILATADNAKDLFNGKDLSGWDGDMNLWSVEKGEIVGKTKGLKTNEFLRSQMIAEDFRLTLKVKLVPDAENSGVQFRSEALPDGEVKGPQADIGAGWWGKLYEEHGRGLLFPLAPKGSGKGEGFDQHVKKDDWNDYEIVAVGSKVKTYLNGKLCVDIDDPQLSRRGLFALQLHSGGAMEVWFREIRLEVLQK